MCTQLCLFNSNTWDTFVPPSCTSDCGDIPTILPFSDDFIQCLLSVEHRKIVSGSSEVLVVIHVVLGEWIQDLGIIRPSWATATHSILSSHKVFYADTRLRREAYVDIWVSIRLVVLMLQWWMINSPHPLPDFILDEASWPPFLKTTRVNGLSFQH